MRGKVMREGGDEGGRQVMREREGEAYAMSTASVGILPHSMLAGTRYSRMRCRLRSARSEGGALLPGLS